MAEKKPKKEKEIKDKLQVTPKNKKVVKQKSIEETLWDSANPKLYRQLEEKALEMRKNPTKSECVLWNSLKNNQLGVKFRQQHVIDNFIADFCSIKEALIIEVDGDSHDSKKEADEERTNILKSYGYKVIRFNNDQIINDLDGVIETIKSEIKNNQKGAPMSPKGDKSSMSPKRDKSSMSPKGDKSSMFSKENKSPLGDIGALGVYKNIPEYCYSATFDEVSKKDFSLVPSKYIEFVNRDENIDFDEKMQSLQVEFSELLKAESASKKDLLKVFKELGYEIKL